jgi:nicotinamidase-related amidase
MTKSHLSPQALLVIDVQVGLFEKSTPLYQAEKMLARWEGLIAAARQAGALVIFIQHSSDKVLPWGSRDWGLHSRLEVQPGDLLVHKTHGNAFEDTGLDAELSSRGITRLALCGLVTHGCVKATCQGALALGYTVTLASDAHSSYSKDAAAQIEKWNAELARAGASVVTADEIEFG